MSAQRLQIGLGEGYSVEVASDRHNPVIGRRELVLVITHVGKGTPKRYAVREAVAKALGVDIETVYVRKLTTDYGIGRSRAEVHVYSSAERARLFEPEYIIARNEPE